MFKIQKINEARKNQRNGMISFQYNGVDYEFGPSSFNKSYIEVYQWLYNKNFDFSQIKSVYNNYGDFYTQEEVLSSKYENRLFVKINDEKYLLNVGNKNQLQSHLNQNLIKFGAEDIKFDFSSPKSNKIDNSDLEDQTISDEVEKVDTYTGRFGTPKDFKAVQSQEEKESPKKYIENPFRQAICILGKSGAGKSYTIDEILDSSKHEYEFIIPSASTTGLLSQFSPSAKEGRGGYIPSRLGKMIEKAYINNDKLYTVVFDECHKSNIIEMINDELLQAISTERNKNRFISLDDETSDLYPSKVLDKRGNISITDNLGFIFISSNARVISGNEDFFNRVDLVELTKEGRESVKTIDDLNKLRVKDTDKKYELVSKIMSESKR